MRRIKFVVLVLMVAVAALPAQAFHDPGYPILATADLVSGDWVRYDLLATEGAVLDVETNMDANGTTSATQLDWTLFSDGGWSAGMSRMWGAKGTRVVTGPTGVLVDEESGETSGGFGSATTHSGLSAGPITVIIGAVADGGLLDVEVIVSGTDVTLLDETSGTGTFAYDESDFAPGTHVRAPRGLVEIAADGHVGLTTDAPLYAWFTTRHRISSTRYEGPARDETVKTTSGFGWIVLNGEPEGEHDFFVDSVAGAVFTGWTLAGIAVPD